jgi:hypothetical protein
MYTRTNASFQRLIIIILKHNNPLCMLAIADFKLADKVPLHGKASFEDIAKDTPLTTDMTARLLRHAMTMRIFRETSPGIVAHTAASRTLHKSAANDWLQSGTEEMWPAAVKVGPISSSCYDPVADLYV